MTLSTSGTLCQTHTLSNASTCRLRALLLVLAYIAVVVGLACPAQFRTAVDNHCLFGDFEPFQNGTYMGAVPFCCIAGLPAFPV